MRSPRLRLKDNQKLSTCENTDVRSPRLRLIKRPSPSQPRRPETGTAAIGFLKISDKTPTRPVQSTLHALGIVQLLIEDLRIIPPTRGIIDVEMPLNLPVDIDHRTIGTMVRDQNLNLRRPILLVGTAREATPSAKRETVSTAHTHAHTNVRDLYVCG